ncbi:MAG: methyltransferase [Clostridia bacterium]|nr:methyltransferase [Clostridia bacterium]
MEIRDNERLDDLQFNNMYIIQDPNGYCFTSDAVLLANNATVKKGDKVCDLGTGSGIIPILITAKNPISSAVGLELIDRQVDMATRSVALNKLEDKIKIVHGDIKEADKIFGCGVFDLVVSNPPYGKLGTGSIQEDEWVARSRYEITVNLSEVIHSASRIVKFGGRVCIINRADRLAETVCLMHENGIETKKIINVFRKGDIADTVIVEGTKGGRPGVKVYKIKA